MNRSFVLGAIIFAAGVSTGIALERSQNDKHILVEVDEDEQKDAPRGF